MRGTHPSFYRTAFAGLSFFLGLNIAMGTTHDTAQSIPLYTDGTTVTTTTTNTEATPTQAASTLTQSQKTDPALTLAAESLGRRIGDLFACVPGRMDASYSTQSWYMLNTFLSFNNNIARSSYAKDKEFGEELKKLISASALAQIKGRNPGLEDDGRIQRYMDGVASTAELVFKSALNSRITYSKSTDIDSLIARSHPANESNVFEKLKAAHGAHSGLLKNKSCVGLKSTFWQTPHFALPKTNASAAAVVAAPTSAPRKTSSNTSAKQSSSRVDSGTVHKASDRPSALSASLIDANYPRSKAISEKLPRSSWDARKQNGYHTYYATDSRDYLWGRPYVIGNILKAAETLKQKGIYMGVGDINRKPSVAWPYHRETPGHGSHDQGRALDLRLIGPDGEARPCTVEQPKCYDRDKTFTMIKALIDADPKELRVIYINDPKLRKMLEDYLVSAHGYSRLQADDSVQYWPCHDNHVHFHWKDDYSKRK